MVEHILNNISLGAIYCRRNDIVAHTRREVKVTLDKREWQTEVHMCTQTPEAVHILVRSDSLWSIILTLRVHRHTNITKMAQLKACRAVEG